MENKKKYFFIVVIGIILAFTVMAIFFTFTEKTQNSKKQTEVIETPNVVKKNDEAQAIKSATGTSWNTYQNTAFGYEMEYPSGWEILTIFGADPKTFSAPSFTLAGCASEDVCPRFAIGNVHEMAAGENAEGEINVNASDRVISKGEIEVSGEKASFVEYYQANYGRKDGGMGLVRQEIKVIHNNTVYRFYIDEYNPDINKIKTSADWEYRKVFEYMLQSFRFVDVAKTPTSLPAEKTNQTLNSEEKIISAFADKHGKDEDEITITIKKEEGNFIRGDVEFKPGGPGNEGMFLAANINGTWTIVYEGSEVPDCKKLTGVYGFSLDMLKGLCD